MMNAKDIEAKLAELCTDTRDDVQHDTSTADRSSGLHAQLTHAIVGAAIEVHRHVGPGQLEGVYQRALTSELRRRGIPFRAQAPIAMKYKGEDIGDFVADFIVDAKVIVELKAVHAIERVHFAQILSYLRATDLHIGLLINFNVALLRYGVRRVIR